jgi:hypothetical protein
MSNCLLRDLDIAGRMVQYLGAAEGKACKSVEWAELAMGRILYEGL